MDQAKATGEHSAEKSRELEYFMRDFKGYYDAGMAAAYRAGLSTAAGICDRIAHDHSDRTKASRELKEMATRCGDEIWAFRQKCTVDRSDATKRATRA